MDLASILGIVILGLLAAAGFIIFAWVTSPENRRSRRKRERRSDRIDLISGAKK
jgi:flagellar basal body-associated protein FliL